MVRWLGILVGTLRSCLRTHRDLALENLALRQQLAVWKAREPRPRLTEMDRIFWIFLSKLWTSWRHSLLVVQPETVVGWHRQGFRRYWAWKSRRRSGRPLISTELRDLIRRMSYANPLWGAPRIHGELLKLGLTVSQATVFEVHDPPSAAAVAGVAHVFEESREGPNRVGFVHGSHRDLSGVVRARDPDPQPAPAGAFQCHGASTAEWTARQLLEACALEEGPRYLIRDRDQVYGERFSRQAKALGIREAVIAPARPGKTRTPSG